MPRASRSDASSQFASHDSEIEKEFNYFSNSENEEITEEDNVSHVVDYIREEIFRSAMDTIYEGYLRKTVYSFVTNCVYEAWMRAFRWVHLEYNQKIFPSTSDSQISDKVLNEKDSRLPRGVPTVYGRLEKLISIQKSPNHCRMTHTKGATRRKIKQLNTKTV